MSIQDITSLLEKMAPPSLQENYDNTGFITGNANWNCTGAIIALDATEAVVQEAIQNNCNLIIAHHPIIFSGLKKITGKNYVEKTVIAAIKNDIAIYAIHTNLDNVMHGVNAKIADKLGLINRQVLQPKNDFLALNDTNYQIGSGLAGELPVPLSETDLLSGIKEKFNLSVIKHTALTGKPVKKVALCGGAGSFLVGAAIAAGADFYISADIKYHEFFDANNRLVIADIGHYESEQFTIDLLFDILREKFPTFAVLKTGVKTNPVYYFL
jgi:dinuclear metal center YbgI/SA1388 family protein